MIGFPNAKINLGLRITGKLPDGYHSIKSLMIPVQLNDILEFVPSDKDSLSITGIQIPGLPAENIVLKALASMRKLYKIAPLHIHLHKCIPFGAGLGGGSADASFFLRMLNDFFNLNLSDGELEQVSSTVGSDCPFFIRNTPAIITGKGERMEEFPLAKSNYFLVIIYPGFPVSTEMAYKGVKVKEEKIPLEKQLGENPMQWKNTIENEFERVIFPLYPELEEIKTQLYSSGAFYTSMSGSGSAVYGIFEKEPCLPDKLHERAIYCGYL